MLFRENVMIFSADLLHGYPIDRLQDGGGVPPAVGDILHAMPATLKTFENTEVD